MKKKETPRPQPSRKISPAKAKEMLSNPPHGKPLSPKQKKLFHTVANRGKK